MINSSDRNSGCEAAVAIFYFGRWNFNLHFPVVYLSLSLSPALRGLSFRVRFPLASSGYFDETTSIYRILVR